MEKFFKPISIESSSSSISNQIIIDENFSMRQDLFNDSSQIYVLVIVCNRKNLIESTLSQLNSIRSDTIVSLQNRYKKTHHHIGQMVKLPIIVSQDCDNPDVRDMIKKFVYKRIVQHHFEYPFRNYPVTYKYSKLKNFKGYYKISRHYKWAIDQTFKTYPTLDKLIIVEDDLNFSPDFFEYFITLAPLLDQNDSIYCISAWNDNGKYDLVNQEAISLLYRTDFFPGLGWMLKRHTWEEIRDKWPIAYWDDWFRNHKQRKNRVCIRPELSRTSTSGAIGVSKGQYYEQHLYYIHHYKKYYPFYENQTMILDHLKSKNYDRFFLDQVYIQSKEVHPVVIKRLLIRNDKKVSYRITYYTHQEFVEYASMFGLMNDLKFGVPRTAYKGIVSYFYKGMRIYLAPPASRKIYFVNWT